MKSEVDNFERSGCQALNWGGAAAPPYLGMETRLGGSLDLPSEQIRKPQSAIRNLPRRSEAKTGPHPARKTKAQKTQREKALLPLRSLRSLRFNPNLNRSTQRTGRKALRALRLNPNPAIRNPQSAIESGLDRVSPYRFRFGCHRAFTIIEMLVVVTIIGLMAAIALPHLPGMQRANSMTTGVQQMLADCALARQLAMSHRTTVYMVFVPPYPSPCWSGGPSDEPNSYTNLLAHQYSAYALVSLRSVGDQPGQANAQYLSEWKALPDGVIVAPWKFTGTGTVPVHSTNSLAGTTFVFNVNPFPESANVAFPFPDVDDTPVAMPYIGFSPLGQLTTNGDEYIPLARGSVFYVPGSSNPQAQANETPGGNSTNNCNLIHLDWLTARAKVERNQQR
jgi:prepilin-type N-terminal cleavage/methylation domain-containing protein